MGSRKARSARTAIALLATVIASVSMPARARVVGGLASTDPAVVGQWTAPFSEMGMFDEFAPRTREEATVLPAAVSIAVSPDGRIIYWNGIEDWENADVHTGWDVPDRKSRTRILDLRAYVRGEATKPTWLVPSQESGIGPDLFCSDLRNLPDGRLAVVGGIDYRNEDEALGLPNGRGRTEFWGTEMTRLYDPGTRTWSQVGSMNHKRWYPSLITLPGGKMLVAGGVERALYNDKLDYVNETETFDPRTGHWTDNGQAGSTALPYYARLHLLPNGKVFYDASGQMWGPFGQASDMAEWNKQKFYDPVTKSWIDKGIAPLGGRSGTFSAMLPLKAPYKSARVLVAGGTLAPAVVGSYVGMDVTEIVTITGDTIERSMGPNLNNRRWHSSGVVLPSGDVIAVNGADRDETVSGGIANAVRQAEMFDGEKWVPLASSARDRVYHHTAILLGDGSVLVGGHAPIGFGPVHLTPDNYTNGVFASTLRDPSFEIFRPPYLFRGARPRIAAVQAGIAQGERFSIQTPDAKRITKVVLSRLPSVTHLADSDQRTVELRFSRNAGAITAVAPRDPSVLLPGHYYMFLMSDNGRGPTPSRAAIVQVGKRDLTPARMPYGS